jgi:SET domain-containing protein
VRTHQEDEVGLTQSDKVEVRRAGRKGRGVFARRPIRKGEVIERTPVLVLPAGEAEGRDSWEGLSAYCFEWGRGTWAMALGYGSLYNHSYSPNARYDDEEAGRAKVFTALRDIRPGEEVTVNYNGDPADRTPVGFEVVEGAAPAKPVRAALMAG